MRILLTGGAGFIGSHTVDALAEAGHDVRVLDLLDDQIHGESGEFPDSMTARAECIRGDVRNIDHVRRALEKVEVVYHFAAHTGVGQSMYELRNYVDTNCTGTATLLQAVMEQRHQVRRLILASSRAVYGEGAYKCAVHGDVSPGLRSRALLEASKFSPLCPQCNAALEVIPTKENTPLMPASLYGWTKLQQEQLCKHVSDAHGLDVVILRYFNVIGSRQSLTNPYTGILTVFFKRVMARGAMTLYEAGLPVRDFVHVRDIVAANLLALDLQGRAGSIEVNVGSGKSATIRDVAVAVAHACGRKPLTEETSRYRLGDIFACVADLTRARAALGYKPVVDLDAAVSEFVEWARTQDVADDSERAAAELNRHGLLGNR